MRRTQSVSQGVSAPRKLPEGVETAKKNRKEEEKKFFEPTRICCEE